MNRESNIFAGRLGYVGLLIVDAFGTLRGTVNFNISFAAYMENR